MVMETPGPQCVGREFVKQYYTMLNEAPLHLHRFYSHNSSFVHGGVEKPGDEQPPVMGQADIHKKIMSLNFKDCHARIRQVDSQATVGSAVVVQVTGELSNNGEPMRRFMQTFVLAPQTPKKFYVHNDIFRYQDEVFNDDGSDSVEEEANDSEQDVPESLPASAIPSVIPSSAIAPGGADPPPMQDPTVTSYTIDVSAPPVAPPGLSNGDAHGMAESPMHDLGTEERSGLVSEEAAADEVQEESGEADAGEDSTPKPFSWAMMAASRGGNSVPNNAGPPPQKSNSGRQSVEKVSPESRPPPKDQREPKNRFERAPPSGGMRHQDRDGGAVRPPGDNDMMPRNAGGAAPMGGPRTQLLSPRVPDSQQLFVGNIQHNVTESDLVNFFEKFGPVVEARINRKENKNVPNFGFVIFDAVETTQKVLSSRPIMLGETRLNVEEKKARHDQVRPGSGSRPPMGRGGPPGPNFMSRGPRPERPMGPGRGPRPDRGGPMERGGGGPDRGPPGRGGYGGPIRR